MKKVISIYHIYIKINYTTGICRVQKSNINKGWKINMKMIIRHLYCKNQYCLILYCKRVGRRPACYTSSWSDFLNFSDTHRRKASGMFIFCIRYAALHLQDCWMEVGFEKFQLRGLLFPLLFVYFFAIFFNSYVFSFSFS